MAVAKAKTRFQRISPSKVRQVINLVRGENANTALTALRNMNKKAATIVYKLIESALANAGHLADEDTQLDLDSLVISTIYADEGPTLKRIRPRAQGRAFRINKRTSHIYVELDAPGN